MKAGQLFALIMGIFFLLAGVMGFVPAFVHDPMSTDAGYGYLLGLFPINYLHNLVHIIVGLAGILTSISLDSSRVYGRSLAIFYGLLTVMGLIPVANTTFGLIPIFGNDVWLHALSAAIAFYFGFVDQPGLLKISTEPSAEVEDYFPKSLS